MNCNGREWFEVYMLISSLIAVTILMIFGISYVYTQMYLARTPFWIRVLFGLNVSVLIGVAVSWLK